MNIKPKTHAIAIIFAVIFLFGCSTSENTDNSSNGNYENPFEYCKAVGTMDTPGSEYTGPKVPDAVAQQLRKDMGVSDTMPKEMFDDGTYWRCMDGSVYACNVGTNLPCDSKADVSKEPNDGMLNYCGENPDSEIIPMYASGRTTVYEWKCVNGTPEIAKQIAETDKAGYIKDIWYRISP